MLKKQIKINNMENNRRSFFKGLAAFTAGVVGAKVASYVPKKEEPKEEVLVPSILTITHDGKEYHPLVVEKTSFDKVEYTPTNISHSIAVSQYKPTIRKANI
jgi:hypothetical protein